MTSYGPAELANAFRTVRKNTIQIAQDIPEEKYDFSPAPGARSVRGILSHIAFLPTLQYDLHRDKRVTTLVGYDFPGLMSRAEAEERKPRSKAEIVELLTAEGDRFAAWLDSLTPAFLAEPVTEFTGQGTRSRFESIMSVKEHEMHHRGQLMLIERMLGVVPHLTRQREERARARQQQARG
jgi:uncharacterized damage-inducible protein DinB